MVKSLLAAGLLASTGLSSAALAGDMSGQTQWMVNFERFEVQWTDEETLAVAEGDIWYGGDLNKFLIRLEGGFDLEEGGGHEVEVEALYSRAVTTFFDLYAGVRHDFTSHEDVSYGVLGITGHAPYWIEVDAAAYVSEEGDFSAKLELERDILLTQRLILQPRFETSWAAEDDPDEILGSGFTFSELGVRLRYDISRQFSPYIGVESEWAHGDTADLIELAGGETQETFAVIGIKFWF